MWAKIDDGFHAHPKVARCSLRAIGLWTKALSWSVHYTDDGVIPKGMLSSFGAWTKDAQQLVDAGLWEAIDDGWRFHDWASYQPTAWDRRASHEATREMRSKLGSKGGRAKAANRAKRSSKTANEPQQNLSPVPVPVPTTSLRSVGGPGGVPHDDAQAALVPAATAPAAAAANTKRTRTGTRLPDRWFPDRTDAALKLEAAHNRQWLDRELERFRDYWQAKTGQQATKLDWTKTWCNWLRSAEDRQPHSRQKETDDWYARSQQRAAAGVNVFTEMLKEAQQ